MEKDTTSTAVRWRSVRRVDSDFQHMDLMFGDTLNHASRASRKTKRAPETLQRAHRASPRELLFEIILFGVSRLE